MAKRNNAFVKQLFNALIDVPDPADEGFCDSCRTCDQLPIVQDVVTSEDGHSTYKRWYFKHDDSCWFGKVFAAVEACKGIGIKRSR